MIFVSRPSADAWRTVRVAIAGWGPTLRLIALMVAATSCAVVVLACLGL